LICGRLPHMGVRHTLRFVCLDIPPVSLALVGPGETPPPREIGHRIWHKATLRPPRLGSKHRVWLAAGRLAYSHILAEVSTPQADQLGWLTGTLVYGVA